MAELPTTFARRNMPRTSSNVRGCGRGAASGIRPPDSAFHRTDAGPLAGRARRLGRLRGWPRHERAAIRSIGAIPRRTRPPMQTSIKTLCHLLVASSLPALVAAAHAADATPANPLLVESNLPLHYPQFDRIHDDDFQPALEQGI